MLEYRIFEYFLTPLIFPNEKKRLFAIFFGGKESGKNLPAGRQGNRRHRLVLSKFLAWSLKFLMRP